MKCIIWITLQRRYSCLFIRRDWPKYSLHRFSITRTLRTVYKALDLWQILRSLVHILVAGVVCFCPLFQLFPTPAHPNLPYSRLRALALSRIAGGVVSVAENILPKRVHAVNDMAPGPRLWHTLPKFHKRKIDCSLEVLDVSTICKKGQRFDTTAKGVAYDTMEVVVPIEQVNTLRRIPRESLRNW